MAQGVKTLVSKLDNLSSIPRTNMVERTDSHSYPLTYIPKPWCTHTHTHKINVIKKNFKVEND